ncbi:PREDICTED: protein S100-A8-like [Buceros rhinoceros silvestris]|uniref:protein S100-A8-like n=1 Tax=Buceros rhinoceros silvestris TaxID=175836 RepID=UPI000528FF16|nr:PREDICTED: protein S100-A8-like [Buceros rhinoceros silvestris]
MKTDLELALECFVNVYHQHAIKNPIDNYLNKSEFSDLLKKEAKPFLHHTTPPNTPVDEYIAELFAKADKNHDGRLKFTEFLTILCCIFNEAHERFHKHPDDSHSHDDDHGHGPCH